MTRKRNQPPLISHENQPWFPNILGHTQGNQEIRGKAAIDQLKERLKTLQKEVIQPRSPGKER